MMYDEILTVKETAVLLKTTRQQVRKMIVNEELPAVKVGREWRIHRQVYACLSRRTLRSELIIKKKKLMNGYI